MSRLIQTLQPYQRQHQLQTQNLIPMNQMQHLLLSRDQDSVRGHGDLRRLRQTMKTRTLHLIKYLLSLPAGGYQATVSGPYSYLAVPAQIQNITSRSMTGQPYPRSLP